MDCCSAEILTDHRPLTDEFGWTRKEAKMVLLTTPGGSSCAITCYGAHVVQWTHPYADKALWMSSLSPHAGRGPIRGGVPIAFPQFANQGPSALHGFARTQHWDVVSLKATAGGAAADSTNNGDAHACAILQLNSNDETRKLWPHDFKLRYTITLRSTSIAFELSVTNTDSSAWAFTSCLHTYLRTADIRNCALAGLQGVEYLDKVDGSIVKVERNPSLKVPEGSRGSCPEGHDPSEGFVDRIYRKPGLNTQLTDEGAGLRYEIEHSSSWPDTVIFNPWENGKRGDKGPDFDDDGFNFMLCVEPAIATAPKQLAPGESWMGSQKIRVSGGKRVRRE